MILALIITLIVLGIAFLLLEIFFLPLGSLSRITEQRWVGIRSLPLS